MTEGVKYIVPSISGVKELRKALEVIANGDEPRPVAEKWRADGQPSKNDKCAHERRMYEDCGECVAEYARAALASQSPPPTDDVVERVARAIYDAEPSPIGDMPVLSYDEQRRLNGDDWIVLKRAHAAIATLSAAPPTDDVRAALQFYADFHANSTIGDRARAALSAQLPPPIRGEGLTWLRSRLEEALADERDCISIHLTACDAQRLLEAPSSPEGLAEEAEFLCARLREFERDLLDDYVANEFYGHVVHPLARLERLLAASPSSTLGDK